MNAIVIGPLVFAPDRFAAILAVVAFLVISEIFARKVDGCFSAWAWRATAAFIIGGRAGHVVQHLDSFLSEPLRMIHIWQGGFAIGAGTASHCGQPCRVRRRPMSPFLSFNSRRAHRPFLCRAEIRFTRLSENRSARLL